MKQWWHLNAQEIVSSLSTDLEKGLTQAEAKFKLDKFGLNQLKEKKGALRMPEQRRLSFLPVRSFSIPLIAGI